ncbi:competence protein ComEA [Blastococcus aggregatus]|uniref:Competence protein ComEA n=1 Tax=Blastococcus aggregatus TaxID=38502 RepID=A0A285VF27_9ACTN|nr:ComEA family DNA-binding protein [Blastococcus aggregatus]SOC52680.1 competence protein ComEA [Blastococcus aggregatus]
MRTSPRRSDDADVIRARLRALLDEGFRGGWVPEDEDEGEEEGEEARTPVTQGRSPSGRAEEHHALEGDGAGAEPGADRPPGLGRHRAPDRVVRWNPGRPGARALWIAGLLAALLVIGGTWWDRPQVEPVTPESTGNSAAALPTAGPRVGEAAETATTVVVAVVGLVGRPGLVTVPTGSRVADAVEAAGGFLPGTDPATVNLAAVVSDGQQIAVGAPSPVSGSPSPAGAGAGGPVNLNTATAQDLDALPGIGPVLAQRIVDHRSEQGRFRSVEQLDDVPGIGPAIAAELAELVTV